MSYSQAYSSQHSNLSQNDVGHAIRSIAGRADDYRTGINDIQASARVTAGRLVKNGNIERELLARCLGKENEIEETMEWLSTQRNRLKTLAKSADEQSSEIEKFLHALERVGEMEQVESYEAALTTSMAENGQAVAVSENVNYQEICKRLGEAEKTKKARGRRRSSDDDDLEVLPPTQESAQNALVCPITLTLLEKPVRNKLCKHLYSRDAILTQINFHSRRKGTRCKCPVSGCANENVTKDQLEDDRETEILVRRQKHLAQSQQSRMSQMAIDADDDEDDEDEGEESNAKVKSERYV